MKDNSIVTAVNWLDRENIIDILENYGGYMCYDNEPTDELRQVLIDDIINGLIDSSVLED